MNVERQRINRDAVLDGAAMILEGGSYSELTVDSLARSMRMSKSTLYKYFQGKEQLVEGMIERCCAESEAQLDIWSASAGGWNALVAVVGDHLRRVPRAVLLDEQILPRSSRGRLDAVRARLVQAAAAAAPGAEPLVTAYGLIAGAHAVAMSSARREINGDRGDLVAVLGQQLAR